MIEIIPAILPTSYEDLEEKIGRVVGLSTLVHIDVCDGLFDPDRSWPYGERDAEIFSKLQNEEMGLPFWDKLDFEFHLMTKNPEAEALKFLHIGASRLIVHAEAINDFDKLKTVLNGLAEIVIALKYESDISVVEKFADKIDGVQLMSISDVGRQGVEFEPKVIGKIEVLRKKYPKLPIIVDGGVNEGNAPALRRAGATRLVVGSAIFGQDDVSGAIEAIRRVV